MHTKYIIKKFNKLLIIKNKTEMPSPGSPGATYPWVKAFHPRRS